MTESPSYTTMAYRILVDEIRNCHLTDWYGDLTIIPQENGKTILVSSFADQAALRGFLDHLWNLNIAVISVERIENDK